MLNLVIALSCEARPLVERFRLEARETAGDYRVFTGRRSDGEDISLIVSGVGKAAAAGAVGYLMGKLGTGNTTSGRGDLVTPAWLSVGMAGHGEREVGEVVLAHKVTDEATAQSFYPSPVFELPCVTDNLLTVDQPVGKDRSYPPGTACDMEASAVFATACRFSPLELIHALKIVSDNGRSRLDDLTPKIAEDLVAKHLDLIESFSRTLLVLQREHVQKRRSPGDFENIVERWKFTSTQRHQLRRVLSRWEVLAQGAALNWQSLAKSRDAREVLRGLEVLVDALPLTLRASSD